MLAICIEASHARGMGHLFRALNLIRRLEETGKEYILLINDNSAALRVLEQEKIVPVIVDLQDTVSDWEGSLIAKYSITHWLNDRLDTGIETARHVIQSGIPLYTIDDMGEGAALAEGNFASLIFENTEKVPGKKVYAGSDYLILNSEIALYRKERDKIERILVTLGGSDTYGVTLQVIEYLKKQQWIKEKKVTVLLGPGALIWDEVKKAMAETEFELLSYVPSLISFMELFDLAITGGGVTALEAAASGLPCVIIANELHEVQIGKYMEEIGSAVFAGYYKDINLERITNITDIGKMSRAGMENITLLGAQRICDVMFERK